MSNSASIIGVQADPIDPEDFDVSEEEIARALADREARRAKAGSRVRTM